MTFESRHLQEISAQGVTMLTPQVLNEYVKARPFRPFRVSMASGNTFDVRHPELIKVLKNYLLVFRNSAGDNSDIPDEFESVSLMLAESVSHLDSSLRQ